MAFSNARKFSFLHFLNNRDKIRPLKQKTSRRRKNDREACRRNKYRTRDEIRPAKIPLQSGQTNRQPGNVLERKIKMLRKLARPSLEGNASAFSTAFRKCMPMKRRLQKTCSRLINGVCFCQSSRSHCLSFPVEASISKSYSFPLYTASPSYTYLPFSLSSSISLIFAPG